MSKIHIEKIYYEDDGLTNSVWYEIEHEDGSFTYMRQPFSQTGKSTKEDKIVWKWDGNVEEPTLTPSFLFRTMYNGALLQVHLFFTKGKIVLCSDSTVSEG